MKPAQGFLTTAVLANEKLKTGDKLRYDDPGKEPSVLGLRFELAKALDRSDFTSAWPELPLLEALVAGRLAGEFNREVLLLHNGEPSLLPDGSPVLRVYLSALNQDTTSGGSNFSGQWRAQLLFPPSSEPAGKAGT